MLKELFKENRDIVINSDIDGFLCGMVLQEYFGCRVVGFSDSRDTVWLTPEVPDIDAPIYIDLYVARPDVVCIEQHIIAYDRDHHNTILGYGTKFNPNLERERTFLGDMESDYYHKYPFGTVHYLIALMAREGIAVSLPDLAQVHYAAQWNDASQTISATPGHVILRADDALYSTLSPYRENALDWWNWLDPDHSIPAIMALRKYIDTCNPANAKIYKSEIGVFFKKLGCDGPDGAFRKVTDDEGVILPKVLNYRDVIGKMMCISLDLPERYAIHKGKYAVQYSRPGLDMDILNSDNLYSYAFIHGPHSRYQNFSYTLDMKCWI